MPQTSCPYCGEAIRYISPDKLEPIVRKHLEGGAHAGEFDDVDAAVESALHELVG